MSKSFSISTLFMHLHISDIVKYPIKYYKELAYSIL